KDRVEQPLGYRRRPRTVVTRRKKEGIHSSLDSPKSWKSCWTSCYNLTPKKETQLQVPAAHFIHRLLLHKHKLSLLHAKFLSFFAATMSNFSARRLQKVSSPLAPTCRLSC